MLSLQSGPLVSDHFCLVALVMMKAVAFNPRQQICSVSLGRRTQSPVPAQTNSGGLHGRNERWPTQQEAFSESIGQNQQPFMQCDSHMTVFLSVSLAVVLGVLAIQWRRRAALQRLQYIRRFELPQGLFERLRKRRPSLTLKDCQLVAHALRQFFLAYEVSGRKFVAMPSQVADDLWHEFILYTKDYESFCRRAFGGFLHHTPAVVLGSDRVANAGLRRCWRYACREENIDPRKPSRLPLLFAIDAKLKIEDGFRYVPDCDSVRRASQDRTTGTAHCGSDFSSASVDGSTDGLEDSTAAEAVDGGGCGGGGCGGGGGGGD